MQPLQDVRGRPPVFRNGGHPDPDLFDAPFLPSLDLLPVLCPQIEQQPHPGMFFPVTLQESGGNLPAPHMGHEDDAAPPAFCRRNDMIPPLKGRPDFLSAGQAISVQKHLDKTVILAPCALQCMPSPAFREEAAVKADADGDAVREEEKISGSHRPGQQQENPIPEPLRQKNQHTVEEVLHGAPRDGPAGLSAMNQCSSLPGDAASTAAT